MAPRTEQEIKAQLDEFLQFLATPLQSLEESELQAWEASLPTRTQLGAILENITSIDDEVERRETADKIAQQLWDLIEGYAVSHRERTAFMVSRVTILKRLIELERFNLSLPLDQQHPQTAALKSLVSDITVGRSKYITLSPTDENMLTEMLDMATKVKIKATAAPSTTAPSTTASAAAAALAGIATAAAALTATTNAVSSGPITSAGQIPPVSTGGHFTTPPPNYIPTPGAIGLVGPLQSSFAYPNQSFSENIEAKLSIFSQDTKTDMGVHYSEYGQDPDLAVFGKLCSKQLGQHPLNDSVSRADLQQEVQRIVSRMNMEEQAQQGPLALAHALSPTTGCYRELSPKGRKLQKGTLYSITMFGTKEKDTMNIRQFLDTFARFFKAAKLTDSACYDIMLRHAREQMRTVIERCRIFEGTVANLWMTIASEFDYDAHQDVQANLKLRKLISTLQIDLTLNEVLSKIINLACLIATREPIDRQRTAAAELSVLSIGDYLRMFYAYNEVQKMINEHNTQIHRLRQTEPDRYASPMAAVFVLRKSSIRVFQNIAPRHQTESFAQTGRLMGARRVPTAVAQQVPRARLPALPTRQVHEVQEILPSSSISLGGEAFDLEREQDTFSHAPSESGADRDFVDALDLPKLDEKGQMLCFLCGAAGHAYRHCTFYVRQLPSSRKMKCCGGFHLMIPKTATNPNPVCLRTGQSVGFAI